MNDVELTISEDVSQFLKRCIHTLPHLKCVLLMWETAPSIWTEVEIAIRVSVGTETAKQILRDLAEQKLIFRRSEIPVSYAFDALSDFETLLPRVASEYQLNPNAVMRLIYADRSTDYPTSTTQRSCKG